MGDLDALARYGAGWDGRAAAAANPASFRLARDLAGLLAAHGIAAEAGLHADGNPVLVVEGPGFHASLKACPDGVVAAYVRDGDVEWDADLPFDGAVLPESLAGRLRAG